MEGQVDLLDLQLMISEGLQQRFPEALWVRAELGSVQVKGNGHCYMELSQSSAFGGVVAKARAVCWRSRYAAISRAFRDATGGDLRPGIEVLLLVSVNYSELYGLSLDVQDLDAGYTMGAAELERRRTVERLEKEDLLDIQKSVEVPFLPYRLAVISASGAAGYGDFCRHLQENEYGFKLRVELFEALMQGEGAPASIIDALGRVEDACAECGPAGEPEPYDAVLILRGGGSALDLACFDDYALCRAIAMCPLPVFTAIGHDRDFHVADMVAHDHVKTPTALADLFLAFYCTEDERVSSLQTRIRLACSTRMSAMESRLSLLTSRLRMAFLGKVAEQEKRVALAAAAIASADPRNILSRGYSLTTDERGVVLKSAASVKAGDAVSVRFADGVLRCEVKEVTR